MSHSHENADKARQFIKDYIRTGSDVIEEWLSADGSVDAVGEELILLSLDRYRLNGKYDLPGLAGPYVEGLFRYAPGGHSAAIKTISSIIEAGEQVPAALFSIHLDLIRGIPLDSAKKSSVKKLGPKSRIGRRDALLSILLAVIKAQFNISLFRNDAFSGDSDTPPYAMEIIKEELLPMMPDLEDVSIKSLEDGVRRFEAAHQWFVI